MKKLILTLVVVFSLVACNKNATVSDINLPDSAQVSESISNLDSTFTSLEDLPKLSKKQTDSALAAIKNVAVVKIEDLKEEKDLLTKQVAKELDSATKTAILSEIKVTQNKIDSVKNRVVAVGKQKNVAPKIIKETKVIYKDSPVEKLVKISPKTIKNGEIEIAVEDLESAITLTKENIRKYDGTIKNEQISSFEEKEFDYLQISVPFDKSDYLINDLEENVGTIVKRNIEISGVDYTENTMCDLEITLVNNSKEASAIASSASFGGRSMGAIGSGWNVIQEIFLFILPFWPLFLIGGGVFYYFKKKKSEEAR